SKFDPPAGTEALCDGRPPSERPSAYLYLFDPNGAAQRTFGTVGQHDDLVGEWASRALRAQPGDFADFGWRTLRGYWVPSSMPRFGGGIDPQLDFASDRPTVAPIVHANLEHFYDGFEVRRFQPGLDGLRALQHVTRFGALLLSITTVLVLVGLLVGDRRSRIGVLLFGVGGLVVILGPALT